MASIQKRPNGRWRARYRDAAGKEHARHFDRKVDAERWLRGEGSKIDAGTWTDPNRARVTVGELGAAWLDRQLGLKESTRARYAGVLNGHVLPTWGSTRVGAVDYEGVAAWVQQLAAMGLAASSVRQCHRVLSLILADAVKARRIPMNPAEGVDLPRVTKAPKRFLTAGEVECLAKAAGEYRAVILTLAYTGMRFGELVALRVRRTDLLRRRLTVAESATEVGGRLVVGTPKTHQVRTVPVPKFLVELIAPWLGEKGPDDLVFTAPLGGPLRINNFRRRVFDPAAREAGLEGLTPHSLRHTAASLAIASGANVKDVQQMLGHASAAMTLDVYAGLFDDGLDAVADRMDAVARSAADSLRTNGSVSSIPGA